ncbi:serine hydrolase domain-containing protein [Xanthocytophaga agilis]|uniref:Serine hydrolase domain-containing protein n=1 Tax=Xanthocytophaga agilis TaxID=3048010 RepID=A0AAE3R4N3_9BACT|nr:serine hydrolase domain-containing protein [Xanthocytophaga agilis]MDJ1503105.1 serine hydrolase domain-containing protein [Xanthocytophaga agilis]
MRINFLTLFFSAFIVVCCKSAKKTSVPTIAQLEAQLKNIESHSALPGFAVAIVNQDGVVYQKGFGYANLEKKIPYTPETIQPVGSVSKTFIALAIQKAIEQGHFTLETKINDILPFPVNHPKFPEKAITIRQLVTHTSGILDNEAGYQKAYQNEKKPTISLKEYLISYLTPKGTLYTSENFSNQEPGIEYNYTNIGSALGAYLIEAKTNISYAEYVRQYILQPLHMQDSHWFYDPIKADQYALLYNHVNKPYDFYSLVTYPDGGLRTSCHDLSLYLIEMIKGYTQQGSLLTGKSYQYMFSPQFEPTNIPAGFPEKYTNQSMFWTINRAGRIMHTGGDPGLSAFISFDPQKQTGRILLINTEVEENEKAVQQIKEITEILQNVESHLN